MNILIVDDIATNLKLLDAILEAEGHSVFEAADGVEALEILEREKVDVIISDILMPRMDGYRFCYEVRASERFRRLPFIFHTSSYTSKSDEKLALEMGADKFLTKPAPAEEIIQALHEATTKERTPFTPVEPAHELNLMKEYNQQLVAKLEQKNAELTARNEELIISEQNLLLQGTALATAANAVLITDAKGIILWVNPALLNLTGYTAGEVVGQTPRIFKSGQHDQKFYKSLWSTILAGKKWHANFTNRRKDGSLYHDEHTITPVRSKEGTITHFIAIMNDVSERKQLEAQFIEAQKMEVVGQLAGGVAHDFNNVLAVIMGYTELVVEDLGPDHPLQKYIEEIRHAAERAAGLTRQLLVFSRKQTVQAVELDLNEVVKGMEKMLRQLINENIEMKMIYGGQVSWIKADSGYVWQVLMNLVVNARDAMPEGGKLTVETSTITLDENYTQTHAGVTPGDHVMLSVSDTGIGMTEEVRTRLFEAFFTTKAAGKGTGLGLVTCQNIVRQSGGHIDLFSEVGKGTTFKIYFPQIKQPLQASTQPLSKAKPLRGGTETLLVVEDEPSLRHLAQGVLHNQGYEVLTAPNGQDALRVVREHRGQPISLVITDVIMPRMGGKVMAEWLKTTYPDIKILYTSGYTENEIAHHGALESGVEFLPKPYSPASVIRKVRELLDAPKT
jgi:two-component system cell cycle sensor histidine kinase/response regulator CckA